MSRKSVLAFFILLALQLTLGHKHPAPFSRANVVKYAKRSLAQFGTFSLPTLPLPAPTVTPTADSLTGLPIIMSFDQQAKGGFAVQPFPTLPSLLPTTTTTTSTQHASTTTAPAHPKPTSPSPAPIQTSMPTPAPQQQATTPTTTRPAPAPATPSTSTSTACSKTDRSAAAVFACVNAMRTNPGAWTASYPCDWRAWINAVSTPVRPAFKANAALATSAARQAKDMAGTRTVSHVGSDGSSMQQRIYAAGFRSFPQAENVAGGQQSALEVAAAWMCSEPHRGNIMSCDLDSVGSATSYDFQNAAYYVQDFGCSVTNSCHC